MATTDATYGLMIYLVDAIHSYTRLYTVWAGVGQVWVMLSSTHTSTAGIFCFAHLKYQYLSQISRFLSISFTSKLIWMQPVYSVYFP
jgi:hypothetical protein